MELTLLGTGCPKVDYRRFGPANLVSTKKSKILIDCGSGATQRLHQAKVSSADIDALFLTHLHSDHTIGLSDIIMTGWIYQRDGVLNIYGPKGTIGLVDNLKKAYSEDISIRTVPPENHSLE